MAFVSLTDLVYPVGTIIMTTSMSTVDQVQNKFGGTWEQIKKGLIGAAGSTGLANNNATGGSSKITISNIPNHGHTVRMNKNPVWGGSSGTTPTGKNLWNYDSYQWVESGTQYYDFDCSNANGNNWFILPTGGGQDYYPAHYSCYIFRRTA